MNRRDIVIGLVMLVLIAGVIYWRQRNQNSEELKVPETLSSEESFEQKFNLQIPDDVDKADLKDVSGGTSSGFATRKFENDLFTHSVLADLQDPETGKFYEGWLLKGNEGEEGYSVVSSGRLTLAKGGWMLELRSQNNLSDYTKVLVSLEEKSDRLPEKNILEGSF